MKQDDLQDKIEKIEVWESKINSQLHVQESSSMVENLVKVKWDKINKLWFLEFYGKTKDSQTFHHILPRFIFASFSFSDR